MDFDGNDSGRLIASPRLAAQGRAETHEIKQNLRRLDRRDSWYWWNAVLVIMLLMGAIVVLSLPKLLPVDDSSFELQLSIAIRGLLGLVLIFNVYTLYQQHQLRQLRRSLAGQIEIATEQKVRAEAMYELAVVDPLTGLFNRRFCDERLRAEIARAERHNIPLIVILFDLDRFKQINDNFGHAAGDLALREFAHRLNKATRGSDFAVRTGGDEFLLVLTECPPENVHVVLSRLTPFEIQWEGQPVSVSSSRGWTQFQPGDTADQLVRRADEGLYRDKESHHMRENVTA